MKKPYILPYLRVGATANALRIHRRFNSDDTEPSDLDRCRGNPTEKIGFHYHAYDTGVMESLKQEPVPLVNPTNSNHI